jgi:DNA topoisomerase-1
MKDGGGAVRDARTLERIGSLRVPPAWRDVHIAANPRAMLQAWGIDARGRKQYRYHESAVRQRESRKYYRVRRLARDLPTIRATLHHDMSRASNDHDRVAATVVRLISKGFFRYRAYDGSWHDLEAREVNDYIRRATGFHYTAKDFRTWGGTLRVATILADLGEPASATEAKRNVRLAVRLSAAELGNTPAVCRSSYVHPILLARYVDDFEVMDVRAVKRSRTKDAAGHYPEERALIRFLDVHFPERRSERRA